MRNDGLGMACFLVAVGSLLTFTSCHGARADQAAEAPPPAKVTQDVDIGLFTVDHPEQFQFVEATGFSTSPDLVVTGTVTPDISRTVPVISLASGRVVAIHARLGDTVKAGQLLLSIRSSDISGAFSDYRKALTDEILARAQYERAQDLHTHGAMALNVIDSCVARRRSSAPGEQAPHHPGPGDDPE